LTTLNGWQEVESAYETIKLPSYEMDYSLFSGALLPGTYPIELSYTTDAGDTAKANFEFTMIESVQGVSSLNFTDEKGNPLFQTVEGDTLKISLIYTASAADVGKTAKFYVQATSGDRSWMLTDKGVVAVTTPLQVFTSKTLSADKSTLHLYTGALLAGEYSVYVAYETANGKEEVTSVFTVKGKQTVTFTNLPTSPKVGEKANLTLTGGNSNNPIVLTSTTTDVCTVQDKTVTFIAEGNCAIGANQAGNETFVNGNATGNIAVKSAGVFSLSVTDKDGKAITEPTEADTVNIRLTFKAPTDDIGKTARFWLSTKIQCTGMFCGSAFQVVELIVEGPDFEPLNGSVSYVLPKDPITISLYSGTLPQNKYTLHAEYQTEHEVVEATIVLKVGSKVEADTYAQKIKEGFPESYARGYAIAKASGRTDTFAHDYATCIFFGKTSFFAEIYAMQIEAGKSGTYAFYYAQALDSGKSNATTYAYAPVYATQMDAGKSEKDATTYATTYASAYLQAKFDWGQSVTYATAYATARASGKSEADGIAYAAAYEHAYVQAKTDWQKSDAYATAYATARASGKSEKDAQAIGDYAVAYAQAKIDWKKSDAYAGAYATQRVSGKSEAYASAYAQAKFDWLKSYAYATAYATAYAKARDDWSKSANYAEAYAKARTDGKSEVDATTDGVYATTYATAKERGYSDTYAAGYATKYAAAYATAKKSGKSEAYATAYAQAIVDWKKSTTYAAAYATARASEKSEKDAQAIAEKAK